MSLLPNAPEARALGQLVIRQAGGWRSLIRSWAILFKLRIVALLLLAAVAGAFLGAGGWPGLDSLAVLLVTGGMAASGASAFNQYLERVSDGAMRRTQRRPLVTGAIERPKWVLITGSVLVLLPSLAVLPFNSALAFFLIFGAFIYVGVYTMWLKPRTPINIVIGGAAGSAAVLSGGAAVDAWHEPAVLVLALLIFLWTPTHFWSLAILYHKDYRRAGVPMLPSKISSRQAAFWVLVHTLATVLAALALGVVSSLGWVYILPVALASARLLWHNLQLLNSPTPGNARALFMGSNVYLMIVLLAACITVLLPI